MKNPSSSRKRGFTLLETVIAIGVLAVLLTGFIIVFAPAAAGIKKAINVQEADRLTSTLEQELVTFRKGNESGLPAKTSTVYTGFDKAFGWIMKSNSADDALLVYQYRGSLTDAPRTDDNTPTPVPAKDLKGKVAGKDYSLQTMLRRKSDSKFMQDLEAVEGGVYLVKCTQIVFNTTTGGMIVGKAGEIIDPKGTNKSTSADDYPEAVIAFSAEFFNLSARSVSFFESSTNFSKAFTAAKTPVFTRNLAVRR